MLTRTIRRSHSLIRRGKQISTCQQQALVTGYRFNSFARLQTINQQSNNQPYRAMSSTSSDAAPAKRKYKFYREDFGPLVSRPLHLDLYFDIIESRVIVTNHTTFRYEPVVNQSTNQPGSPAAPLNQLKLNSKDLEIVSVDLITDFSPLPDWCGRPITDQSSNQRADFTAHVSSYENSSHKALPYELDTEHDHLVIQLPDGIQPNQQFVVRLITIAKPTAHILEGLYYDYTPSCCPRTIITQCQQYGFQRITPCMDYMNAKSYYTTTITADKRYTNVITNGDLAPGFCTPDGKPVGHPPAKIDPQDVDKTENAIERQTFKYHNHITNMAPYLFFLGCGTYQTFVKRLEYPDGDTIQLELLCFPGLVEAKYAEMAVQSLHDSVMWVYVSTGPEAHLHDKERAQVYELIKKREDLKNRLQSGVNDADSNELTQIRAQLKQLVNDTWKKTGYKYTGAVYREIAMQNSDYGGMENVGNTTILASRLVPSPLQSDPGYIYMESVKVHEYYHNINGSEVTGQSPFEIWLNEAVTVHIQEKREEDLFGADFMRLKTVLYAFMPSQGPLAMDKSIISMAIEPEGFNRTQELISAMTYSKAPEFIAMVRLLIGDANFNVGLDHYHTKFRYSNASTADWIASMEQASGMQLMSMAQGWLKRTGYPEVKYHTTYDAASKQCHVHMTQTGADADGNPWDFPVSWALVKNGRNTHEGVYRFDQLSSTLTVDNVTDEPDFVSYARNWSFFGTSENTAATPAQLRLQALTDPDTVNRYFAYRAFVDSMKADLVRALVAKNVDKFTIDPAFVELHSKLLFDSSLSPSTRAMMLSEPGDIPSRPELGHKYWELFHANAALMQAIYDANAEKVINEFERLQDNNVPGPHLDGIHDRALKAHLYRIMHAGAFLPSVLPTRTPSSIKADVAQYAKTLVYSPFMTDQTFGLTQFLSGPATANEKQSVQQEVLSRWSQHPDTIENYISAIASVDSDDTPSMIRQLINNQSLFNFELSGHARTVARGFGANRKRSLLTDEGLALTVYLFITIGKVNQMSAQSLLQVFSDIQKMTGDSRGKMIKALRQMRDGLDPKKQDSLTSQIKQILDRLNVEDKAAMKLAKQTADASNAEAPMES